MALLCSVRVHPDPTPPSPHPPHLGTPHLGPGRGMQSAPHPALLQLSFGAAPPTPNHGPPPVPTDASRASAHKGAAPQSPKHPQLCEVPPSRQPYGGGSQPPVPPPIPPPPNGTCTALGPSVARSHVGVWQRCEERSCQAGKADGAPLWGGGGSVGLSGGTWDRSHLNGPIRDGSQRSHCRSRKPQSSRERPQGLHGGRSCSAPHPRPAAHAVAMGAEPGGGPVTAGGGGHCGPPTVGVRSLSGAVRRRSSLIESYL